MIKLAVLAISLIIVLDFTSFQAFTHYRDYLLAAVMAFMLQPWVVRQFD